MVAGDVWCVRSLSGFQSVVKLRPSEKSGAVGAMLQLFGAGAHVEFLQGQK